MIFTGPGRGGHTILERVLVRSAVGLLVLFAVTALGGVLLYLGSDFDYTIWDTMYFSLITVSTVGFGELPHLDDHPFARVVTSFLIVAGLMTLAFFQSSVTALFIEGVITKIYRRRRMQKQIGELSGHLVVAGCGSTGEHVVHELLVVGEPFVAIDLDERTIERLQAHLKQRILYIVGDATDDDVLEAAGVRRAKGVICALTDDKNNLFVALSAREMNPHARIVSKVVEDENDSKLKRAGADQTVSPNRIGGLRLVSELVRPHVVEFLDSMLRITGEQLRFDQVHIPEHSHWVGQSLRELPIRERTKLLVVAIRHADGFKYNPDPDEPLCAGDALIVIGEPKGVRVLQGMVGARAQ